MTGAIYKNFSLEGDVGLEVIAIIAGSAITQHFFKGSASYELIDSMARDVTEEIIARKRSTLPLDLIAWALLKASNLRSVLSEVIPAKRLAMIPAKACKINKTVIGGIQFSFSVAFELAATDGKLPKGFPVERWPKDLAVPALLAERFWVTTEWLNEVTPLSRLKRCPKCKNHPI